MLIVTRGPLFLMGSRLAHCSRISLSLHKARIASRSSFSTNHLSFPKIRVTAYKYASTQGPGAHGWAWVELTGLSAHILLLKLMQGFMHPKAPSANKAHTCRLGHPGGPYHLRFTCPLFPAHTTWYMCNNKKARIRNKMWRNEPECGVFIDNVTSVLT